MAETYRLKKPAPPRSEDSGTKPPAKIPETAAAPPKRLTSLDAYRGFIMTMLAASGFGIARMASLERDNPVWQSWNYDRFQQLRFHFDHPAWESLFGLGGVAFWDLIQPAFMLMVGVAMPFSDTRRRAMGGSNAGRLVHALLRAIVLTLMGVFLYSINEQQTTWGFTNVLAQIGLGYFFVWLLLGRTLQVQVACFAAILIGYWGFFVMHNPPVNFDYKAVQASREKGEIYEGRFARWSKNSNAGHFFDVWFLNLLRTPPALPAATGDLSKVSDPGDTSSPESEASATDPKAETKADSAEPPDTEIPPSLLRAWFFANPQPYTHSVGGYLTLNFIPSMATILLGVFCGQLLLSSAATHHKFSTLVLIAAVCFGAGLLAHHTVCPVVKRIWTPSWVLLSGGYVVGMLSVFFLLFDMLPFRRLAFPLVVVGADSIVMYMMGQLMRPWVTNSIVQKHFGGVLKTLFGSGALDTNNVGAMVLPTATFAVFWLIAYWMYRNRYIVRI